MPHLPDRRAGWSRVRDRCRSALPCIAGALRRSLLTSAARAASCSVRRLPGPFPRRRRSGSHHPPDLWVDARRVLVPFTARLFVMSAEYEHEPREASSTALRFVARAVQHRQGWIARVRRICRRPFTKPEDGAALRLDHARVTARPAQTGLRAWPARRALISHGRRVAVRPPASTSTLWRRGWDSNPRSLSTQRFSRAPPSTARPPLRAVRIPAGFGASVAGQEV
jgi:hypothetical protein